LITTPSARGTLVNPAPDQSHLLAELEKMKKLLAQIKMVCVGDANISDD